jgi:hypothetical protein
MYWVTHFDVLSSLEAEESGTVLLVFVSLS